MFPIHLVHPEYGAADAFCATEAADYIKRGFVEQPVAQEETHDPDVAS